LSSKRGMVVQEKVGVILVVSKQDREVVEDKTVA
jgi:hypothetical protein